MSRLPHGYQELKNQANADALRYTNPVNYHFFKFDYRDSNKSRIFFTVPKGHMLIDGIDIRVIELFTHIRGGSTVVANILYLSTLDTDRAQASIAVASVSFVGVQRVWIPSDVGAPTKFLTVFKKDTPLTLYIHSAHGNSVQGRGWGMLKYLNMAKVPGYNGE